MLYAARRGIYHSEERHEAVRLVDLDAWPERWEHVVAQGRTSRLEPSEDEWKPSVAVVEEGLDRLDGNDWLEGVQEEDLHA